MYKETLTKVYRLHAKTFVVVFAVPQSQNGKGKQMWMIQLLALNWQELFFLQVQYTWCTTAANHKIKHHFFI